MTPRRLLDVGGTFVKCDDGRMVPIPSDGTREAIAAALREAVGPPEGLRELGIAIPGPFDFHEGIFRMQHKFAAVYGMSFRELAAIPEGVDVRYLHDVNAPLLGSLGQYPGNTVLVTLGTGLGFGCAIDNAVRMNETGGPAYSLYNRPYGDGILEDAVSARGIRSAYVRLTGDTEASPLTIARRAYNGEKAALQVFSDLGAILGEALLPLLEEFRTEHLLFGGQISQSLSLFERPLRDALEGLPRLRTVAHAPEGAVFAGLNSLFTN